MCIYSKACTLAVPMHKTVHHIDYIGNVQIKVLGAEQLSVS